MNSEVTKSNDDLENYKQLCEAVSNLPHIMRPAKGDPFVALSSMVQLLETPNNLDALWVWSAFAQSFGTGDTWQAERALNTLLNWTATRIKVADIGAKAIKDLTAEDLQFLKGLDPRDVPGAPSIDVARHNAEQHCFVMLEHILMNFRKWRDLPEFVAHKRSLQPVEPKAEQLPLPEVKP